MTKLIFDMTSFSPTQGQWWGDMKNNGIERRVSLVAAQFGFFLWTADFRDARTSKIIDQKWFCSKVSDNKPVALFETIGDRHRWMEAQWEAGHASV